MKTARKSETDGGVESWWDAEIEMAQMKTCSVAGGRGDISSFQTRCLEGVEPAQQYEDHPRWI